MNRHGGSGGHQQAWLHGQGPVLHVAQAPFGLVQEGHGMWGPLARLAALPLVSLARQHLEGLCLQHNFADVCKTVGLIRVSDHAPHCLYYGSAEDGSSSCPRTWPATQCLHALRHSLHEGPRPVVFSLVQHPHSSPHCYQPTEALRQPQPIVAHQSAQSSAGGVMDQVLAPLS